MTGSKSLVGSSTSSSQPFQSSTLSSSNIALPTVNLNTTNIISSNLPNSGGNAMAPNNPANTKSSTPSSLMTTSTLSGLRMISMPVNSSGNKSASPTLQGQVSNAGDLKTEGNMTQNALLKQLLSSSSVPPKSESFPANKPSDETATKEGSNKPTLSTLASQLPKVSSEVSKASTTTTESTPSSMPNPSAQFSTTANVGPLQSITKNISQQPQSMSMSTGPQSMSMSTGSQSMSVGSMSNTTLSSSIGNKQIEQPPEGLAGMIAENSHKLSLAKLPNQPVPPTSLTGVIQVQPNSVGSSLGMTTGGGPAGQMLHQQRPGMPLRAQTPGSGPPPGSMQQGPPGQVMRPGGIQNLLQAQVPVPPGELGNKVGNNQQPNNGPPQQQHGNTVFQQQQQFRMQHHGNIRGPRPTQQTDQQQQFRMQHPSAADQQQQMRMQHHMQMQQQQQQIRMQQQLGGGGGVNSNVVGGVGGNYDPPQQIVGRASHPGMISKEYKLVKF